MANTLLIEKQNGGYFKFTLNEDTSNAITSIQNDLLAVGNELHFKTGNGANIIKEQSIYPADVTIVAAGTFTFTTVAAVWNKLIDVGYFDWLGGGVGGVDRFDELLDTFQYTGNAGKAVIVDNSELKLVPITLYNKRLFTELEDTPSSLVPDKMVVVNPAGTALILKDQPEPPEEYLNSVGYFDYNDLATQTTPLNATANVALKLTNDTEGLNTSTDQNPYGVSYVWDYTTNQFNFTELEVGDTIDVRVHVQVTTTSANQRVILSAKFGIGSVSEFTNIIYENQFKSAGLHEINFVAPFYMGSTYITDNPAELYLTTDSSATVKVDGWYVRILRKNINIITVDYQVPDATTLAKGIVRLAGDLGGTANVPTVPELANKVPNTRTVSTTSPLLGGGALSSNLTLSIQQANSVNSGFLTYADWTRFDEAHNDRIVSAAVTGTTTKTLTLNQHDGGFIQANWTDNDTAITLGTPANGLGLVDQVLSLGLSSATTIGALSSTDWTTFNSKQGALNGTGFVKISGTTISYDNSTYVPTSRTITINGTGFDLSDNRTFNVGTVTSVAALTLGTTGTDVNSSVANGTTTPVITLNIPTASATNRGALSSIDWTTFNSKQGALNGTGFVKVVGATVSYDNSTYALDSVVVKLTGDQSIAGVKTFTNGSLFDSEIYLKQDAYLNPITGYTAIGSDSDNIFINIDGSKYAALNLSNITSQRTFTFPNTSGTFALTSNLHNAVTIGGGFNGLSIDSNQVLSLALASASVNGALSSTDWTTFNNKQNAIAHLEFNNTNKTIWNNGFGNGSDNTSFGELALATNTTGYENTAYGYNSLNANTTGNYNTANGVDSLKNNSSGSNNTASGSDALRNNETGSYNSGFGESALVYNINGSYNTSIGAGSGNLTFDDLATLSVDNSVFIGAGTRALNQSGDTNQIVIGYNAIGAGSNSVVLGNDSIAATILKGFVGIGTSSPFAKLTVIGDIYGGSLLFSGGAISPIGTSPLLMRTNNVERLRILSGGNVGIGTTSPGVRFVNSGATLAEGPTFGSGTVGANAILSANGLYGLYTGVSSAGHVWQQVQRNDGSTAVYPLALQPSGGDVLVGTTTSHYASAGRGNVTVSGSSQAIYALAINGVGKGYLYHEGTNAYIENSVSGGKVYVISGSSGGVYLSSGATSWTANSDNRLKDINYTIENAVDKLCTLNPVSFTWKSDEYKKEVLGLIAQDVEKVFPQIIDRNKLSKSIDDASEIDETEYLGVRYQELIPVLVKAIQELKAEIEILKNK